MQLDLLLLRGSAINISLKCQRRGGKLWRSVDLEAEDLIFKFAHGSWFRVACGLCRFLHGADHGRRAANKDFDVVGWRGKTRLENVRRP